MIFKSGLDHRVSLNALQPPAATASFFERMKFIIEDQGLQSYVQRKGFNERSVRRRVQMGPWLFFSMSLFPGGPTRSGGLDMELV